MTQTKEESRIKQLIQSSMLWIFIITLFLGLTLVYSFNLLAPPAVQVQVGQPALEDVFAPRAITYDSQVALQQAREQAAASVPEQYRASDEDVGRQQLNQVGAIFALIDVIRADTQASQETKLHYLQSIQGLTIEEQVGLNILEMNSADFEQVRQEVARIVGDLMRQEIREDQVREYQIAARREASLELTPTQELVVTSLAPQFIKPTMVPYPERTEELRQQAVDEVQPFPVTVAKDELIVRAGDLVTERTIEKMTQLGLLQRETDWRIVIAIAIVSLLASVLIALYWNQFHRPTYQGNGRYLLALAGLILLFAAISRFMLTGTLVVYLFPMAALSLILAVIYDIRLSMFVTIILSMVIGYNVPNSLEIMMYTAVGGLFAVLTLHDAQRINAFFRAGLAAALGYTLIILVFQFNQSVLEATHLLELLAYALGNGILSAALTLVGFFLMGSLFGLTTTLQLQELSRFDHPLLQELLRRAPGTYHHSIMVANLAEQAADKIKANSTLIRVGAFYHDIGKMNRPPFFTENQEGINPHNSLDPYTSARIILSHVTDGLELARQYKLPDRVRDFIAEHHGTRLVKSFYFKAVELADGEDSQVDKAKFRYVGPRPRSRETGIVMMADAIESASRALQPNTEKEIEKLVNSLIDDDLTEGQLDDSGLTLGDIRLIRESFIKTLKGRFHVRVKYPGNEELGIGEQAAMPVAQPGQPDKSMTNNAVSEKTTTQKRAIEAPYPPIEAETTTPPTAVSPEGSTG